MDRTKEKGTNYKGVPRVQRFYARENFYFQNTAKKAGFCIKKCVKMLECTEKFTFLPCSRIKICSYSHNLMKIFHSRNRQQKGVWKEMIFLGADIYSKTKLNFLINIVYLLRHVGPCY